VVTLTMSGLAPLESAAPKEFDGPGDRWSPEGLLTAAVADCFILSFRAIAAASKFEWTQLEASTAGRLDRVEGKMKFTHFTTRATLKVSPGTDIDRARRLLERAEQSCLIANSLSAERHLEASVEVL
jgi:peroxiredoxin-like protein